MVAQVQIYLAHSSKSYYSNALNQLKWHKLDSAYEDESNPEAIRVFKIR